MKVPGPISTKGRRQPRINNPGLIRALQAVAELDNRETRSVLYNELTESTLLIVLPQSPQEVKPGEIAVLNPTAKLKISIYRDDSGAITAPVFTGEAELNLWNPERTHHAAIGATELFRLLMETPVGKIALNPGSVHTTVVTREEFQVMAQGSAPEYKISSTGPMNLKTGTSLYIGAPVKPPSEALLQSVRVQLKSAVSVSEAFAFQFAVGANTPMLAIGVLFDAKPAQVEVEALFSRLAEQMKPLIGEKNYVDLLALDSSDPLIETVRKSVRPFYRRRVH